MIQGVTHLDWGLVRFVAFFVRFTGQIGQSTTLDGPGSSRSHRRRRFSFATHSAANSLTRSGTAE